MAARLAEQSINRGIPPNAAWTIAYQAAELPLSGPQYEGYVEGMALETEGNAELAGIAQQMVDDWKGGHEGAFDSGVDAFAAASRDQAAEQAKKN